MDIKISVSKGNMDELPSEVMVTTKFDKRKTFDENLEIIPSLSYGNNKNVDVNKVLYSQPSLKKKPSRGSYSNIYREDRSPSKLKNNINSNDITKMLLTMGYSLEGINFAVNKYKFETLEDAIFVFSVDPDTGSYNHQYVSTEGRPNCLLCDDRKSRHIEYNTVEASNLNQLNTHADNSSNQLVEESLIKSSIFNTKKSPTILISPDLIEKLENQFKYVDNLCIICFAEEMMEGNSYRLPCGHRFCQQCMKSYLENLINQSKVNEIKCLHPGCIKLIGEKAVKDCVSSDYFIKYMRFKKRQTYLLNLNNGMVPCVFPNCEEWLSYRDGNNPFLICQYGHRFCAKCKQDWHRPGSCQDRELTRILKKNNKIKACPSCYNIIEKLEGCNHVECGYCHYEFCWLCLGKYTYYHYYVFNVQGCPGMKHCIIK